MKKSDRNLLIFIILFALVTVVLCILFWPFISRLKDSEYREQFSAWIGRLGFKGVLILFGIQVLQIVVAAIPGGPIELVAGAAYGPWGGLAICLAGCVIASSLVFIMVKKFGSPLIDRFFSRERVEKYLFLRDKQKMSLAVFILFLIPGTPKDMLTYIVPLSGMELVPFILISGFARIPAILSTTIIGSSMIKGQWRLFLLLFIITAVIGSAGILFSEKIVRRFKKGE